MPPRLLVFQRGLILAALAAPAALLAAPAAAPGPAFPQFSSPAQLEAACTQGLAAAQEGLAQLLRRPVDAGWLRAQDALTAQMEDAASPVSFLSAVHPDKAIRDASEACELRWNNFFTSYSQNPALYQAIKQVKPADAIDRELLQQLEHGFVDAGVALAPAQRQQAKDLINRIGELGQAFERAVRDDKTQLAFTEAELAGVPEAVWRSSSVDAQGRRLLGISAPEYVPVMHNAELASTRQRMWRAKVNEGGPENLARLAEIARLRLNYARLLGVPSWADHKLRRQMARTPARAEAFLDEVQQAVQAREQRELAELRQAKAEHLKQPLQTTALDRWDVSFYTERVRQARYSIDQEAFRRYFPPEQSMALALRLIERLMGVRYTRVANAPAWHPEVQTYAVSDAASGRALGTLYIDLYPREGKYNHAAVWGLRGSASHLNRTSQAALVVNMDRSGLSLDELETLLHELGHAVHNNLSATRYVQQAGTSVPQDFVEAPSQMLEDWVYDTQVLNLMAEVCPACTPVPAALLAQAKTARQYGKGVATARQHLCASYDLALYGPQQQDPLSLWQRMEARTPLGYVADTIFPAGFGHIATNYSAGYYGYLWSLVVASDLRTAFQGRRLDPAQGMRYRSAILAQGSQRPPAELVRQFLGRDFNAKAFFQDLQR